MYLPRDVKTGYEDLSLDTQYGGNVNQRPKVIL